MTHIFQRLPMYAKLNIKHILLPLTAVLVLFSCEKYEPKENKTPEGSVAAEPCIESFIIEKSRNSQLLYDAEGIIDNSGNIINVIIDYDLINRTFVPTVKIPEGASISPSANDPIDGNKGAEYTVTSSDKKKTYKVVFHINKPLELIELRVNGTKGYYNEESKTYIVPIDKSRWGEPVRITTVGTSIRKFYIDGVEGSFDGVTQFIPEFGKQYRLKLVKETNEKNYNVEFIGLPVVSLKAGYSINNITSVQGRKSDIRISVYDPTDDGKYTIEDAFAGIRIRGAYSAMFPKKSFSLEFRDETTKEETDVTLFGLRNDGDWILDGMVTDVSRMRNRICTDLWNDVHSLGYAAKEPKAIPATRGQMTMVYFNDEFRGVYCMTERVDRKQLKLDKQGGYLYKAEDWNDATNFKRVNSRPTDGNRMWESFQAEYPDPCVWGPLYDFISWVCDNNDAVLSAGAEERFDIDNLVDYFLFINVIGADDNASKNTFLGIYNYNGASPRDKRFFYCPWDLDGTLGRGWDMRKMTPGQIVGVSNNIQPNYLMLRLARNNGAGFGDKVKKRWNELKNGPYSKDAIIKRFVYYKDLLEESGAYSKELSKWRGNNAGDLGSELQYVDSWMDKHLALIDKYIMDWDNNMSKL